MPPYRMAGGSRRSARQDPYAGRDTGISGAGGSHAETPRRGFIGRATGRRDNAISASVGEGMLVLDPDEPRGGGNTQTAGPGDESLAIRLMASRPAATERL